MKKTILIAVATLALGAVYALANCGNCPGDKKADAVKAADAKPADAKKHDCGDCPMSKKDKKCPEMGAAGHEHGAAKAAEAKPADAKKAAPAKAAKGKPAAKAAKAAKKYMCAMKCVETAAPGKCPKCGMPLEEVK